MIRFLLFSFFLAAASAFNWTQPDLGRACRPGENGTAPGIKYYEDRSTFELLPFFYRGCGGDRNRYNTPSPRTADAYPCPGYPHSVGECTTEEYDGIKPKTCPSTAYCVRSLFQEGYGKCCDIGAKEREYENRQAPQCKAAGLLAIKEKTWYGEKTFLGRNCSHNFCPQVSTCQQGEFYAYCCTKDNIVIDPYASRQSQ